MAKNNMTAAIPATANTAEFKSDPIAWAKRGNKIILGNVCDLKPDSALNIRFRTGSSVFGVAVEKDTYDLPSMKMDIVNGGGIQEPILVSVRADGTKVPLRGNRRTFAGQELATDDTTPAELRKHLTESTPMVLLSGLTPEQEEELIQDQTQKEFLRSEVVRHIFNLRKQGMGFELIANRLWPTLGKWTGNYQKLAEVREITDPALKREKLKSWLRGTLDCYLLWAFGLGQWMQKQVMLSEMLLDGILPKNAEQPYFKTTKNSQKRVAALKKAKDADGAKFNGMMLIEGSEFKKQCDVFHQEDYGTANPGTKPSTKKMLNRESVTSLKDAANSRAVRAILERVLGDQADDAQMRDESAAIYETKSQLVEQYLGGLTDEVKAIVSLCMVNPDPEDFVKFLIANQKPDAEMPEQGETPPAAE